MGEVFAGRYELADPIGRGGVGAVWRAWDHRRRRYVAAKVLQQRDAHALLRFVREQALRIDHPHVLAPASWAADDDKVLFTMDLVAGGSLVHLIGDYGPLPPAFVCTLLDQLLSGLSAVHAEGVVHRDIKPANILLEATGTARPRLRLSDFGIAMRLGEPRLTETNLVVGTPGYLAPEQMLGSEPDFPADLFAVGLVALYLLQGAKPDAKALVQYFAEHGTPAAPKGVPEPLWQVVAMLLQPDPQARFRTATGARKALAEAVELLPDPGPDDEQIEIFDQLGPLPDAFGPQGPLKPASGITVTPRAFERTSSWQDTGGRSDGTSANGAEPAPPTPQREPDATPDDPRGPAGATPPPTAPDDVSPGATSASSAPSVPSVPPVRSDPSASDGYSLSDTGSFHLPPPQPTAGPPSTPSAPSASAPAPLSPYDPTFALSARTPSASGQHRHADTSTASYTAQDAQAQPSPLPTGQVAPAPLMPATPTRPADRAHRAHRRARAARRPGPPLKVAVPVLLLALACYAVGFWALARI
ncbi:serine/threonine-protein kinase [Streptomyces sp. NPDC088254]|uniref:serine/threonine-protein kinase n=1 Tax=Streptomyces sp. NPDC088254 TaxID=3365847 RepID=UPI0038116529